MQHRMFSGVIPRAMLFLIIGLIIVSTGLFVTSVLIEHSASGTSTSVSTPQKAPGTSHDADNGHEPNSSPQTSPTAQKSEGVQNETVFGLALENPWFVTVFVLGWLVLIVALLRFGRITLPVILLLAVVVTVLDVGEVMRQIGEARSLLATLAILVALLHVALAALALLVLTRAARQSPAQQV